MTPKKCHKWYGPDDLGVDHCAHCGSSAVRDANGRIIEYEYNTLYQEASEEETA